MTLEEAAQELDGMTPESLLEHFEYIHTLENRQGLPEAPASVNFKIKTKNGTDVQFTMRDVDEIALLKRFNSLVKLMKNHGSEPVKRDSSASTVAANDTTEIRITSEVDASVIDNPNVERFDVTSLEYGIGKVKFLMVKGGVWTKFGWRAYPEVIPTGVDYESWDVGVSVTDIPENMKYAFVDKTEGKRKIVAFAA
jgi:hypothetical protein